MYLCSYEPTLTTFLHGYILRFTSFEVDEILFGRFFDHVGGDALEGFENVRGGEGGIGFGGEDVGEAEVGDTRSEAAFLYGS
jgi:hypothetical protein